MHKRLKHISNQYAAAKSKHVRTLKRVGKKPLFTVPIATFMVLLSLAAAGLFLNQGTSRDKDPNVVVVTFDKKERTIPTDAKTVGELLERLDVKLRPGDVIEPSEDTEIASDNFRVNVYRAVPVTIVDGKKKTFSYSAAATPRSIVKQAGVTVYPEDKLELLPTENFLAESSIGERVVVNRATPVNLNVYGTKVVVRTHAETVADLIKEKQVNLDKDDSVIPAADTPITPSMQVFLVRKDTKIKTVAEVVPMPVEDVADSKLAFGTVAVRQQGSPGKKLVTYQLELKNGKVVSRKVIQTVITEEPVKRIVARGSVPLTRSLQEWLRTLRQCESGGNYRTNTGNGFYGAYQFMISTWDRIAARVRPDLVGVRPDLANPADQDYMIIANTNLSSGGLASQNPGCYRKEGLSQFPPANH
jgi:uncharacterized protein YabE (DUF348 family)